MATEHPPVTVETHEPSPTAGRPCVATFTGREGQLALHVQRDDGSLWLFAAGPLNGDRGGIRLSPKSAGVAAQWLAAEPGTTLAGSWSPPHDPGLRGRRGYIVLREPEADGSARLTVRTYGASPGRWTIRLDPAALDAFRTCLRDWANAAGARLPVP